MPRPRSDRLLTLALWLFVALALACVASCGGESDEGREEASAPGTEAPEQTPAPEPSREAVTRAATPAPAEQPAPADASQASPTLVSLPEPNNLSATGGRVREFKPYLQMSEEEKYDFIEQRARHVSEMISNGTYEFNEASLHYIKEYVDAYARRVGNRSHATWGEDLNFVFARAQRYAPTIIRAFNERRVPAALGLYIVAVETEYNNIPRENFAGAAGLFQFIGSTAESYGVPRNERTNIDKMAPAAANYIADRIAEFGTDPMSVVLGIAGYNRNPDSVRNDLSSVMNSANKERSFWTLVANSNKLDRYFQGENIKYVPKFFAAAIVGETPWAFRLDMKQALSTYTEPTPAPSEPAQARAVKVGRRR